MSNFKFDFKEYDEGGLNTLNAIAQTHRFNKWMYEAIRPYLKGEVLEIGSGIGNITQYVADDQLSVTASDIRDTYCQVLKKRFAAHTYVKAVRNIDIAHPQFEIAYKDLLQQFDCVFALNTIEHIEQHQQAVANCRQLLRANGRLIILVPAFQSLYNNFDRELQHFRRYTKSSLEQLLSASGFTILHTTYFNVAGVFGWWFSGNLQKNKILPPRQLALFNRLVPVFKAADTLFVKRIGLSVISVGEKT